MNIKNCKSCKFYQGGHCTKYNDCIKDPFSPICDLLDFECTPEALKGILLEYLHRFEKGKTGTFEWPTQNAGYFDHLRFIGYRNKYWRGGSREEWIEFIKGYISKIDKESREC